MRKRSEPSMRKRSEPAESPEELREKIIGFGERSGRKSFYPELRERLSALERFRALLDQTHEAILVAEVASALVTDVNQAACRMLERTRQQLTGLSVREISPALANLIAEARGGQLATTLRARSGRLVPVEATVAMGVGAPGRDAVVVARDVSERQSHERALRESEERFRLLVEGVKDYAIFMLAPEGTVTTWNAGAERLKGYRAEEVIGQHFSCFFPEEDVKAGKPRKELEAAATRGRSEDEGWRVKKDGSRFWASVLVTAIRDKGGDLLGFADVTRDFSERRLAEQAVERSRQGLAKLAEASLSVISRTDTEGMLQGLSDAALALTGARIAACGHGLLSGQPLLVGSARVPGAPHCPLGVLFQAERSGVHMCLLEGVQSIRLTDAQLRAHPSWWGLPREHVPMRGLLGVRLLGRGGRSSGMILATDKEEGDFTEEDESLLTQLATVASLALQHVEARISLEEADRRKNEFLAMLSHELRNPLAPIRNSLFILDRAEPGGEQAQRAQAVIDRQVAHMTRLVDDLLDVTRISRGKVQLVRETLDLAEVARRAAEDHLSAFVASGVALEVTIAEAPVRICGDRTRVAQVIGNLLQNAWRFTPAGGKVSVSVEASAELWQAVARVRDTGAGIAPEMLPRLFEPFTQADTSLDRSKGGLGLGLALVKGLVEMHGGTVSAVSEGLGHGAEFTVRFPLEHATPVVEASRGGAAPGGRARRVLIIEDNVDAAETLREVLEFGGHVVEVAYIGTVGIQLARAFQPDVVLCDIGLPGMDGYEVARAIRIDPLLRHMRLVALTGYAAPDDVARAREAGFDRHVAKPPSLQEIEEALTPRGGELAAASLSGGRVSR
jgi:PAS domain S-box-containing protein